MKLSNIFKKSPKNLVDSKIEKIEKSQLEKVIGGLDVVTVPTTDRQHSDITITKG
jgi:hypothetical protein